MELSDRESDLIYALYEKTILEGMTYGQFREVYHQGGLDKLWNSDDAINLENSGLVKINSKMLMAGIMCLSLTDEGKGYMEKELQRGKAA